jgi:hypothetical protein
MLNRVNEVVNFLAARSCRASNQNGRLKSIQNFSCWIRFGLYDKENSDVGVILIKDGPDILVEAIIDTFAGADDENAGTLHALRSIGPDMANSREALEQRYHALEEGDRTNDVQNDHLN